MLWWAMTVETERDLAALRRVGRVVRLALEAMRREARPGITTLELDAIGAAVLRAHGARSAPKLVYGFPGETCISLNHEAVHGIPDARALRTGDLLKLDVTAELEGYMADAALSLPIEPVRRGAHALVAAAEAALTRALQSARAGRPLNEIGRAIEGEVRRRGFQVLPELRSHGVGRTIHEEPSIPQYWAPGLRGRFQEGQVVTIEPIISAGTDRTCQEADGWTISTADGSLSAHVEHTLVVTRGRPIILTAA